MLSRDRNELVSEVNTMLLKPYASTSAEEEVPFVPTTVICGPRGCGKSTLISRCMCEGSAFVQIFYEGKSNDEFAITVLQSLNILCLTTQIL